MQSLLDSLNSRAEVGEPRRAPSRAFSRLRRLGRVVIPVLCKFALLLTMAQATSDSPHDEELKKEVEECLVIGLPATARHRGTSQLRRCDSHVARRAPTLT